MPRIDLIYGLHFNEMAGKYQEIFEFQGGSLADLISALDKTYGQFAEELVDPESGGLRTRNQILVQREGKKTRPLFTMDEQIFDGDTLTFY